MEAKYFFVFDVESVGLHGDVFSYGYVVVENASQMKVVDHGSLSAGRSDAQGTSADHEWISANVPPCRRVICSATALRNTFWVEWVRWRAQGAVMVADCPWPVEARFLQACIDDEPTRQAEAPYPLIDVASVLLAAGMDPIASYDRLPSELPKHDPVADAMQSARLLLAALNRTREARERPQPPASKPVADSEPSWKLKTFEEAFKRWQPNVSIKYGL